MSLVDDDDLAAELHAVEVIKRSPNSVACLSSLLGKMFLNFGQVQYCSFTVCLRFSGG